MTQNNVALRVQGMKPQDQVLILSQIAEARSTTARVFTAAQIAQLYLGFAIPPPKYIPDVLQKLKAKNLVTAAGAKGVWRRTPLGKQTCDKLLSEMDLVVLAAESVSGHAPSLGTATHPVIPPSLAPPKLIPGLRKFLETYPFDTNVFGMTRFPDVAGGSSG